MRLIYFFLIITILGYTSTDYILFDEGNIKNID